MHVVGDRDKQDILALAVSHAWFVIHISCQVLLNGFNYWIQFTNVDPVVTFFPFN